MTLRMNRTEQAYSDAKAAGTLVPLSQEKRIVDAPQFEWWTIIANRFPHDRHHEHHVMAVLKRDCPFDEVSHIELSELWHKILPWADQHFDYVKVNLSAMRSINATVHVHLLTLKEDYK